MTICIERNCIIGDTNRSDLSGPATGWHGDRHRGKNGVNLPHHPRVTCVIMQEFLIT